MHRKAPGIKRIEASGMKQIEKQKQDKGQILSICCDGIPKKGWKSAIDLHKIYSPDDQTNNLQNRSQIWEWEVEVIKWNLQECVLALDTERVKGDESGEKARPWRPTELCCGMMNKDSWSAEKCRIEVRLCGAAIIDWWACISEGSVRCIKVDLKAALNPIVQRLPSSTPPLTSECEFVKQPTSNWRTINLYGNKTLSRRQRK